MATYEFIDSGKPDGAIFGSTSSDKIGFYGKVPVVIRPYSSAVHATAGIVSSTGYASANNAALVAAVQELQKTLIGLGLYATA